MPRAIKYVDEVQERVGYYTKIFMYSDNNFNNIFPIVEIIKNMQRSIIGFKYGKGQNTIKTYGTQYWHLITGYTIKKEADYLEAIVNGNANFIFIYSDSSDYFSTNLINIAKKHSIPYICYSNLDNIYHFYNNGNSEKVTFTSAIEVIEHLEELNDYHRIVKIASLFPGIDILPEPAFEDNKCLDRCIEKIRSMNNAHSEKMNQNKPKQMSISEIKYKDREIIKRMKREVPVKYDDEPVKKPNSISKFFKG